MLVEIIEACLFEDLYAKTYFASHSKEIAADATHLFSQLIKYLSKVMDFNALDYLNENSIEHCPLLPQGSFSDELNEMFNYAERNNVTSA